MYRYIYIYTYIEIFVDSCNIQDTACFVLSHDSMLGINSGHLPTASKFSWYFFQEGIVNSGK